MLERINAVIYPHEDLPAATRRRLMAGVGFSDEKIHTSHQGQNLVSGRQAVDVFNALMEGNPEAFVMVAFPGQGFQGTWEDLVGDIFESVILRLPKERQEEGRQTIVSIRAILDRIRDIRTVLKTQPSLSDDELMEATVRNIDPLPSTVIMDEVRERVLLTMFSHGGDYRKQGEIASYLRLIDNVFTTDMLLESKEWVCDRLQQSMMERKRFSC